MRRMKRGSGCESARCESGCAEFRESKVSSVVARTPRSVCYMSSQVKKSARESDAYFAGITEMLRCTVCKARVQLQPTKSS